MKEKQADVSIEDLPDEIKQKIKEAAQKCGGSNYTKNHMPGAWQNRYDGFIRGAVFGYAAANQPPSSNIEGDEMKRHFKQVLKRYVTDFYFWWHNSKGTNTRQGYEQWEKDNDLTIDILMREAGYAANQPQPHESIEEEAKICLRETFDKWTGKTCSDEQWEEYVEKESIQLTLAAMILFKAAAANQEQRGDEEELWNKVVAKVAVADLVAKVKPGDNDALNRWKAEIISDLKSTYKISKR